MARLGNNPLDTKEKRKGAIEEWRKLVPKGKLPARPKLDDK